MPGGDSSILSVVLKFLDVVQFGRTLDLGSRGHGFDSCHPDHFVDKEREIHMIDTEIDALKREIREARANASKSSDELKQMHEKIFCIEMINSIIAYSYQCGFPQGLTGEEFIRNEEHKYYNYLAEYVKSLGRQVVAQLIEAQIADVASVQRCVFIDDEGLSYNSIVWKR